MRFGFTVSKKVGNAVERNRVRRRLREIVRLSDADRMRSGHDYVLIGRRAALKVPFARIAEDFEGALRRVHAGRERQHGIPMTDNKNTILAIALSAIVLIGWQFFFAMPQREGAAGETCRPSSCAETTAGAADAARPAGASAGAGRAGAAVPAQTASRAAATSHAAKRLWRSRRASRSPPSSLQGSIALKGGRIDDLALIKFRETVDPKSPPIVLLSPSGSPEPFYAEFGWTGAAGANVKIPTSDTAWSQQGSGALTVGHPVTLTWDNGAGLEFRRTIAVDDKYLFTVKDEVVNKSTNPVSLYPYALISRHGTPKTLGYYILHEGLIGVMGDKGEQKAKYSEIEKSKLETFDVTNGWLGFTDKYFAAALLPDTTAHLKANFAAGEIGTLKTYQTDYLLDSVTVAPGATGWPTRGCSPAPRK